jgi:hypothetical protein
MCRERPIPTQRSASVASQTSAGQDRRGSPGERSAYSRFARKNVSATKTQNSAKRMPKNRWAG